MTNYTEIAKGIVQRYQAVVINDNDSMVQDIAQALVKAHEYGAHSALPSPEEFLKFAKIALNNQQMMAIYCWFQDNLKPAQGMGSPINALVAALKSDEGYWLSWKANIATAFKDEYAARVESYGDLGIEQAIHEISNQAAERFFK
jgi:hypothetical protein